MPKVTAYYVPGSFSSKAVRALEIACSQVVPAALNTEQGRLTPGSIEFFLQPSPPPARLSVDALIDIEAQYYPDREPADDRANAVKAALNELLRGYAFAVWPKLVNAGWASDNPDPDFDGDLSMDAAIKRAQDLIENLY